MNIPPRLTLVAWLWGAWVLLHLFRTGEESTFAPMQRWEEWIVRWQLCDVQWPSMVGFVAAQGRHLLLILGAAAFALACAGIGRPVVGWIAGGPLSEAMPLRVLIGFGVSGGWLLGLALSGLWSPAIMLGLPCAMLVAELSRTMWNRRKGETAQQGEERGAGTRLPLPGWLALGAVVSAILSAFLPDVTGDPDKVHLAAVSQWLTARRLDGFAPTVGLHFPMTVEMNYSFALLLGRSELAHLIHLVPLLAAVGWIAMWAGSVGGSTAGWLAGIGILAFGTVGEQMGTAKSDLAAAAFLAAGAVAAAHWPGAGGRARLVVSGVLFGFGAASKINGLAVAGAAVIALPLLRRSGRGPGPHWPVWVAAMILPVFPWLAKNWLLFGDPVWPTLSRFLPGARWDETDQRALALLMGDAEMTPGRWAGLLSRFARGLAELQPAAALAIPVVVMGVGTTAREIRWLAGFGLLAFGAVAVAAPFEAHRLALPAWIIWIAAASVMVAGAAKDWRPARSRFVSWSAALLAWAPVGGNLMTIPEPGLAVSFLTGAADRAAFHVASLTTYEESRSAVATLPDARRIILIGDGRLARYPCRVVTERFPGRNFGWQAAGESPTAGRVAVKMKQAGCCWIVYNVVWEPFPHPLQTAWVWDDRRLRVWREFVGRHLEVGRWPVRPDDANGGFAFLLLRKSSLVSTPEEIPYLPGIQSLTFPFMQAGLTGRVGEGADLALDLIRRVPGVHAIGELAGIFCGLQGRRVDAERVLRGGVLAGYPGRQNIGLWANAMEHLGRGAHARRILERRIIPGPRSPESRPGR